MPQRDSLGYTFGVAAVLCVVCSLAVSAAAVALRPAQEENKQLDRQRNILDAAGLALGESGYSASELSKEEVAKLYSRVEERLVNLETGEYATDLDVAKYDPREAAKKEDSSHAIEDAKFDIGVDRREKVAKVYLIRDPKTKQISQVVLPVYGKGLWSTLYGYLAVRKDLETVQGLTFYEHAETPGLGGEVDNPGWKAQWVGLKLYDEEGNPAAAVAKGPAPADSKHLVDGLSGATITSRGVTNLIGYWTGPDGYGQYLEKLSSELSEQSNGGSNVNSKSE
ncbi:MAG: Na(+)-translocating NADH-quinone reductase subunit C [Planctomycetaceae bacterium]